MSKFLRRLRAKRRPAAPTAPSPEERAQAIDEHPDVVHADVTLLDAETREMYREARDAAEAEQEHEEQRQRHVREFVIRSPFQVGFVITLGVLAAILFGGIIGQLSTIIMYVVGALFIALALEPLVRWLERRSVKRPLGIAIVFASFILIVAGIFAIIIPVVANQIVQLVQTAPAYFNSIAGEQWFLDLKANFGEYINFEGLLQTGRDFVGKPESWAQVAGGVWQAGVGIANGLTAGLIVLILSLYFLASLQSTKRAFYSIVARSNRARVIDITEQITKSVGGYVNGIVILAIINSVLGFIMMTIIEVPFAGLVAFGVFFLALIPLFGSVLATVLVSLVALFNSPTTAIIAAVYYLIYMQVEAYLLTPRIMNKVVAVPGALVVIGALAGGTLLGLLGALISIPVTAMILMIIKQVWVPRQELK